METSSATADGSGGITDAFASVQDNAKVSGIDKVSGIERLH